ncbi:hypothetical protein [Pelosinus sp. sgz500959]|uniref:hypothetical protein n=1 Tax=Pelosinus sp. sgz500959 TaxID=3242472 RepID=UPI00366AA90A
MSSQNELMTLIGQLPEEKIPEAILLIKNLLEKESESGAATAIAPTPTQLDPLDAFMSIVVHSMTNAMYDLSTDARRKDEKVMANRFEAYRKKLSEGWQTYQGKK